MFSFTLSSLIAGAAALVTQFGMIPSIIAGISLSGWSFIQLRRFFGMGGSARRGQRGRRRRNIQQRRARIRARQRVSHPC